MLVNAQEGKKYHYQWYREGGILGLPVLIAGADNSVYIPTDDGTYYVTVVEGSNLFTLKTSEEKITVNLIDHEAEAMGQKAATCTEEGHDAYWKCTKCGKMFSNAAATKEIDAPVVIPKKPHSLTTHASYLAATCTTDGHKEHWACTNCNTLFWDAAGTRQATAEQVTIPAHGLIHVDAKAATCTVSGNIEHWQCSEESCGKLFADKDGNKQVTSEDVTLKAPGHKMKKHDAEEATCTEVGSKEYWECETCGHIFADKDGNRELSNPELIPAAGHKMKKHDAEEATCTEDGHEEYWECETCGHIFSDEAGQNELSNPEVIPATGHDMGEWKVTKEATVQAKGIKERVCRNCGYKETAEIPMLTPDKTKDDKKAADKSAATGDDMDIALYGLLALAAAAGAAAALHRRKTNE